MLKMTGTTKGEYFRIECAHCTEHVDVDRVWWQGGAAAIEATCHKCNETDVFRLITPRWKCLLSILPENG